MTVARYKGTDLQPRQIAREVGVGTLVRCVVWEEPTRARLRAELIRDDVVIWSKDYDGPGGPEGTNSIQVAVARDIARELGAPGNPSTLLSVERPPTSDSTAWRLYRLGRHLLSLRNPDATERSVEFFRSAIAHDSSFAWAYVGLAEAILFDSDRTGLAARDFYPEVGRLLRKALALDPGIAEAHTLLGLYLLDYTHDWSGAEDEHRQAIALNPTSVDVHIWYGWYLKLTGRLSEAVSEAQRALELDPTNRLARAQLVQSLTFSGDHEGIQREVNAALEIDPDRHDRYYHYWAMSLLRQGLRDSALATLRAHRPSDGSWWDPWIRAAAGERDPARRTVDSLVRLNQTRRVDPYQLAALHAGLGDSSEALAWLERSYEERSAFLLLLLGPHPAFDGLRAHPQFRELREKAGFGR